jgi:hypothetical protein
MDRSGLPFPLTSGICLKYLFQPLFGDAHFRKENVLYKNMRRQNTINNGCLCIL